MFIVMHYFFKLWLVSHTFMVQTLFVSAFGYGTLAVAIISAFSVIGIFLVSCQKKPIYKYLLSGMMALAFSALVGDATLHLIPLVSSSQSLGICMFKILKIQYIINIFLTVLRLWPASQGPTFVKFCTVCFR